MKLRHVPLRFATARICAQAWRATAGPYVYWSTFRSRRLETNGGVLNDSDRHGGSSERSPRLLIRADGSARRPQGVSDPPYNLQRLRK
jgi:hypothetical protein